MDFIEFRGKNVDEALQSASIQLRVESSNIEYEVIEEGSAGFLGFINSKPAVIKARKKLTLKDNLEVYLESLFAAMNIETIIDIDFDEDEKTMNINLTGSEMGILIGKRGQTLDALQYLISLYVNKGSDDFIRVKLDTENYRARRKETLENLARNIAVKVKRGRKPITLEPMNPYERRIIHSTLQNDKYVTTRSEGEEPNRRVIIELKKYNKDRKDR